MLPADHAACIQADGIIWDNALQSYEISASALKGLLCGIFLKHKRLMQK